MEECPLHYVCGRAKTGGPNSRSSLGRSPEALPDYPSGARLATIVLSIGFHYFFLLSFVPGFTTFCLVDLLLRFSSMVSFDPFALMLMVKASHMGCEVRGRHTSFYVTINLVDFMRIHSFFGLSEAFENCKTPGLVILSCSSLPAQGSPPASAV
jgi:hypothetical protein